MFRSEAKALTLLLLVPAIVAIVAAVLGPRLIERGPEPPPSEALHGREGATLDR